jgi:uncharacterized iron-regulated membrane protein
MKTDSTVPVTSQNTALGLDYRTVWRWHFYAGLFCIPFVLWLSVTGTIFLFHPQIQQWLDRPYDHLSTEGPQATVDAQVKSALAAVPGSVLAAYQLPFSPQSPAQVLADKGLQEFRVYVNPRTLQILKIDNEDRRIDKFTARFHGELLVGDVGSWIVELAASWAVIMIITGLFLWWPRNVSGVAGVLYPRLRQGQRIFWRDIHAVTGIYVSFFALFLLLTGLPWAKSWGAYLKAARHFSSGHTVHQDWTTSSSEAIAARVARTGGDTTGMENMAGMSGMHHMEGMGGMSADHSGQAGMRGHHTGLTPIRPGTYKAIDMMVATVAPLNLPNPVLISPPTSAGGNWTAKSDTRDRPLRVDLVLNPSTGAILKRTDFHSKPWLDRVIGTGVAAHEGQLFGFANQMLSLFTAIGLFTLSISALVMWWRRRPEGALGAPVPLRRVRASAGLVLLTVALALYFPFLGGSMILVALVERFVLGRVASTRRWLGLQAIH